MKAIHILTASLAVALDAANGDDDHATNYGHTPDDWLGTGSCSPPCDNRNLGEFCGADDRCHPYSCRNWYRYGPAVYVGHEYRADGLLECEDGEGAVPNEVKEWGVVYGCRGYSNTEPIRGEGVVQKFTERCIARNRDTIFLCYDMSDDTDFSVFQQSSERGQVDCENNFADGPLYIYQVHLFSLHWGILYGSNSTIAFDEMKARRTMWMQLSEKDAAESAAQLTDSAWATGGLWARLLLSLLLALTFFILI